MEKEALRCALGWTSTPWLYNLLSTSEVEMGLTLEVNSLLPSLLIGIAPIVILAEFVSKTGAYAIQVNFTKISHTLGIGRSSVEKIRHQQNLVIFVQF